MPAASQINTSHTVMRNPRTHGWPERLPGSSVMREVMPQTYHSPCNEVLLRSLTAEIKRVQIGNAHPADTRLAGAFAWLERDARSHASNISLALQRSTFEEPNR